MMKSANGNGKFMEKKIIIFDKKINFYILIDDNFELKPERIQIRRQKLSLIL